MIDRQVFDRQIKLYVDKIDNRIFFRSCLHRGLHDPVLRLGQEDGAQIQRDAAKAIAYGNGLVSVHIFSNRSTVQRVL